MQRSKIVYSQSSCISLPCDSKDACSAEVVNSLLSSTPCVGKNVSHESVDRIWQQGDKTGIDRTGTPMFIAMELSGRGHDRINYHRLLDDYSLENLMFALQAIEANTDISGYAFPDSSGITFMGNFAKVFALETARVTMRPRVPLFSDPLEIHRAHHDMESIYWDLLWRFVRALPKGHKARPEGTEARGLDMICEDLLQHTLGNEISRYRYFHTFCSFNRFLHPTLDRVAGLLELVAQYFHIPWHIHVGKGTVEADHAHHALHRLLLPEIIFLHTNGREHNIPLDNTQPRIFQFHVLGGGCIPNEIPTRVDTEPTTRPKRKFSQLDIDANDAERTKRARVEETDE